MELSPRIRKGLTNHRGVVLGRVIHHLPSRVNVVLHTAPRSQKV